MTFHRSALLAPAVLTSCFVALGVALGGCGHDGDTADGISQKKLAELTQQRLAGVAGPEPESVECDGGLGATVGIKQRCALTTPDNVRFGVTVTATKVSDDGQVSFEAVVDDKPLPNAG